MKSIWRKEEKEVKKWMKRDERSGEEWEYWKRKVKRKVKEKWYRKWKEVKKKSEMKRSEKKKKW